MKRILAPLAILGVLLCACDKETPAEQETNTEEDNVKLYVNTFAYNTMNIYYLWNAEIASGLKSWTTTDDPIEKVAEIRYKDTDGNDIDKWTELTDDFSSFTSSVQGTGKTYGYEFQAYWYDSSQTTICAVITLVYPDSPAEAAGLKRGDAILKVNGETMTKDTYRDLMVNGLIYSESCKVTVSSGKEITMSAKVMYEDPVIMYKTFEFNGKKVGYLLYNSFTIASYSRLIEACNYFKGAGVTELVLDLRYNGGGYALTELTLASMLAPQSVVSAGKVATTEVYNSSMSKYFDGQTCFKTEFEYTYDDTKYSYSTKNSNIGLNHIYALITGGSASASESLITSLRPYMDVTLIGEQSYGKYCSGIMYSAEDWYEDYKNQLNSTEYSNGLKYTDNWGIYVMISRFADKDGNTPCMPDGFTPDISVNDNPIDGYQLGDENETLLKAALSEAGKVYGTTKAASGPVRASGDRLDFNYPKPRILIEDNPVRTEVSKSSCK